MLLAYIHSSSTVHISTSYWLLFSGFRDIICRILNTVVHEDATPLTEGCACDIASVHIICRGGGGGGDLEDPGNYVHCLLGWRNKTSGYSVCQTTHQSSHTVLIHTNPLLIYINSIYTCCCLISIRYVHIELYWFRRILGFRYMMCRVLKTLNQADATPLKEGFSGDIPSVHIICRRRWFKGPRQLCILSRGRGEQEQRPFCLANNPPISQYGIDTRYVFIFHYKTC